MTTEQWLEKAIIYFSGVMPAGEAALFEKETAASEELSQLMKLWRTTDKEAAMMEQHATAAAAFIATHQKLKADFIEPMADEPIHDAERIIAPAKRMKLSTMQWVAVAAVIIGIIFMVELLVRPSHNNGPVSSYASTTGSTDSGTTKDTAANLANEIKDSGKNINPVAGNKASYEKLYADNFTTDAIPENQSGPLEDAYFYYATAQYKNAINAIDNAKNKTGTRGNNEFTPLTNFYASYYKALSMMSLANTAGAIPLLQNCMLQSPAGILKAKAQWYLSLAYIHQENIAAATATLQSLINNPSAASYKTGAEKMLTALKK